VIATAASLNSNVDFSGFLSSTLRAARRAHYPLIANAVVEARISRTRGAAGSFSRVGALTAWAPARPVKVFHTSFANVDFLWLVACGLCDGCRYSMAHGLAASDCLKLMHLKFNICRHYFGGHQSCGRVVDEFALTVCAHIDEIHATPTSKLD